jgi:hypothetical protein
MAETKELAEGEIFQLKWSFMRLVESEEHMREVGKRIGHDQKWIDGSVQSVIEYQEYVAGMLGYDAWILREELGLG